MRRFGFRVFACAGVAVGRPMADVARAFKWCGRHNLIPIQILLLLLWAPLRGLFLALYAGAMAFHQ